MFSFVDHCWILGLEYHVSTLNGDAELLLLLVKLIGGNLISRYHFLDFLCMATMFDVS